MRHDNEACWRKYTQSRESSETAPIRGRGNVFNSAYHSKTKPFLFSRLRCAPLKRSPGRPRQAYKGIALHHRESDYSKQTNVKKVLYPAHLIRLHLESLQTTLERAPLLDVNKGTYDKMMGGKLARRYHIYPESQAAQAIFGSETSHISVNSAKRNGRSRTFNDNSIGEDMISTPNGNPHLPQLKHPFRLGGTVAN